MSISTTTVHPNTFGMPEERKPDLTGTDFAPKDVPYNHLGESLVPPQGPALSEPILTPAAPDLGENVNPIPEGKDLDAPAAPAGAMDLDGKLEEENFGQGINESTTIEDVSTPLSKQVNKGGKKGK